MHSHRYGVADGNSEHSTHESQTEEGGTNVRIFVLFVVDDDSIDVSFKMNPNVSFFDTYLFLLVKWRSRNIKIIFKIISY